MAEIELFSISAIILLQNNYLCVSFVVICHNKAKINLLS